MTNNSIDIIEKAVVFEGYFKIERYRLRHGLFSGGTSQEISREVFERGHAAAILPYDPVRDELILIEQFRIGAYAADWDPWLLEIPAGIIEDGETAENVARREIVEETGQEASSLVPIARYLASPGGTSETIELFCARVETSEAGGIHGLKHEGEDIKVLVLPVQDALAKLKRGEIGNSMTLIALQWLALNHNELRERWSP